jgi:hypothetical protein
MMPARSYTVTPARVIAKTIERYKRGERVIRLAAELGVCQQAVYQWIRADKKAQLERVRRAVLEPERAREADKTDLALENQALKDENQRLWAKLRELMFKYREL